MNKLIFIMLTAFCTLTNAQTVEEYLIIAADSNAALKAKFFEYQAALEQVPQVSSLPDPEVSFGYFISPVETRVGAQEARFSVMQMFPWFGTLGVKKDVKTEIAKAKYELFEQAKNDLFYKVKLAYYKLYEVEKSIEIKESNIEILKTYESLASTKFENGKAGMVDVLRIQMEIAESENDLLFLKDKYVPLQASFNQYLNRDFDEAVSITDTLGVVELLMNKSALSDSVQGQNNHLKSLDYMQNANQYSIKVAKKMGAPSFSLGVNYILVSERTDMVVPNNGQDAFAPMLSVKVPLYRGKYRAKVKEANLNLISLEYMENEQRNILQSQLEMLWAEYQDAGRRITLYQDQIKIAEQALNILIESYSTDGKDFEEILRVQRLILKYELKIIKAVVDKNTAVAKIESLM